MSFHDYLASNDDGMLLQEYAKFKLARTNTLYFFVRTRRKIHHEADTP